MAETGEEARTLVNLFEETVRPFGWKLRAAINRNVKFTTDKGEEQEAGIDALFTFRCPYEERERGIVVDGKRYAWSSMGGPSRLSEYVNDVIEQCVSLRKSGPFLERTYGIDPAVEFNTAAIAWDCHDGWREDLIDGWLTKLSVSKKWADNAIIGLVFTKKNLDRLRTIYEFRQKHTALQFHYQTERYVDGWTDVLAPEAICSDLVAIRYKTHSDAQKGLNFWRSGAFYFHEGEIRNSRFIVPFLKHHNLFDEQVTVHVAAQANLLDHFKQLIKLELEQESRGPGQHPDVALTQLTTSEFKS